MRALSWVLLVAVAGPLSAGAQVAANLDLGGNRVTYADTLELSATTLSGGVTGRWPRASLGASGSYSRLDEGAWSVQGLGNISLFTPAFGLLSGELAGIGGGSTHRDGTNTGMILGIARAHLSTAARGIWLGGGAGSSSDGTSSRATRLAEAGGWLQFGNGTAALTASPTVVEDSIRYTDFQLALQWLLPRLELSASGGTRSGRGLEVFGESPNSWGSVGAVFWFAQHVGLVAGAGRYPVDLMQGYPGGSYASLALRLGTPGARTGTTPRPTREVAERATVAGITQFNISTVSGRTRLLRVHAPGANSVEISGDFTLWDPVPMTRANGGWWTLRQDLAPGSYEVNVRVNGGEWLVPPGVAALRDEFGGTTGVLTIN
jgi:hypothetical protein